MDQHEEYWKLGEIEQRFNATQSTLRALASSWLLAAFGAIAALVYSKTGYDPLFPKPLLIALVSAMGSVGLFTIWILDQLVYQRLLNSAFLAGLKMEHDDPTLPPVRAIMMHSAEGIGMSRWIRYFYFVPVSMFLLITAASLVHSVIMLPPHPTPLGKLPESAMTLWHVFGIAVLILVQVGMISAALAKSVDISFKARAELFGDPTFTALFDGERRTFQARKVIERYRRRPDDA